VQEDGFDYGIKPDFGDPEVDRQTFFSVYGVAFLLTVYILCAALDVADLFLSIAAPQAVAKLACAIQPLALVAVPFSLISPASDPCLGQFREPAVSFIFLSVKMTMAFVAFAVLWVCWNPDGFRSTRDIYLRRFNPAGGYRKELKSFARNSLGILVFFTSCFLLASINAADPSARFVLAAKFVVEDGVAVAAPVLVMDFIAKGSVFVFFAWTHRNPVRPGPTR
jgi:hypothetical protein